MRWLDSEEWKSRIGYFFDVDVKKVGGSDTQRGPRWTDPRAIVEEKSHQPAVMRGGRGDFMTRARLGTRIFRSRVLSHLPHLILLLVVLWGQIQRGQGDQCKKLKIFNFLTVASLSLQSI